MQRPAFRYELVWMPLVLAALLLVYLPGLDNPLVFDDSLLTESLFTEYAALGEPRARFLSYGSFVWVQEMFGEGWWKQRLFNLLLHIGVALSLWALYRELLGHIEPPQAEAGEPPHPPLHRSPALGLAIAFFALNPVAAYGVAYLIQRSILMATLFVVLGLWAFARGVARRSVGYCLAGLACYALAVASKEHAILAPAVALPLYVLVARPSARRLAAIAAMIAVAVGAAAWFLLARYGQVLGQAFDEFSRVYLLQLAKLDAAAPGKAYPLSIMNQAWLFFEYGVRWMLPYTGWMSISLRPPFPLSFGTFPQVLGLLGYVAVLVASGVLLLRYRDWRALLGVSLLIPALLFGTEFATVWVQDPFVLYRSYLWGIGIPGLILCLAHGATGRVLLAIGIVVGGLLSWQSLDRVLSMSSPEEVWTDAIRKLPNDARAVGRWFPFLARGNAYLEREELDLAIGDYARSSALGDIGMGAYNMGAVQAAKGRHAEALTAFDQAEKQGYDLYNLPVQRGLSLMALNRGEEAYGQFVKARALNPPSPTRELVLMNLGRLGLLTGKPDAALRDLEELARIDARNKEGRYLLGMAYVGKGENDRARDHFTAMLAEAQSGPVYYGRALANFQARRRAEVLADIQEALRADPRNPQLRALHERILALP